MKKSTEFLFAALLLILSSSALADVVTLGVSSQNITCYGYSNGSITINILTGTGDFDYRLYLNDWPWNGGTRVDSVLNTSQASHTFSGLKKGRYFIIVEDIHGDPGFSQVTLTEPAKLDVTGIGIYSGISCASSCDGQLIAHVTGGTKPYTYVWSKIPGGVLPDTDSIAENLCQGVYKVEVNDANNCGSPVPPSKSFPFVESNPFAKDSIGDPLAGGTISSSQTICYNNDVAAFASVSPASGGSGTLTYTWQFSTTSSVAGSGSWTDIPASNSLTWDYGTLTQTTYFVRRAVDPLCGTVYSNVLTVTVRPQLTGGSVASDQTICYNNDVAAFTSSAPATGGSGSITYTWQYSTTSSTAGAGSWTNIPASNSVTWDYGTLTQTTYFVRRAVDVECGTVYSNVITVTVRPQLNGGTIASSQSICYSSDVAAFTSPAPASGGSGSFTYTWQYSTTSSTPGSGSWTDIPASNSTVWDYGTLTQTTYFVRKAVDAVCGTIYSNVLTVNVNPQLNGGTIASNQTVCYNSDVAAFTSSAPASGGSGTITYTWQYSTTSSVAGSGSWTDITASNSLTWDYGTLTQTTYFVRKAVDPTCGTAYSNVLTVTVNALFTGGTIASNQTICYNNDVAAFTSSAPASGGSGTFTYTWQYSTTSSTPGTGTWTDIPASNSPTWDYANLTQTTYFVRKAVDQQCGTVYSNVVTITVNPQLSGGTIGSNQTICYNNDVAAFTSSAPASGGSGTITYTWQYSTTTSTPGSGSWSDIPASNSLTWDYGTLTQSTWFVRKAVDPSCGTVYSNVILVTVNAQLAGGTIASSQTLCYNNDVAAFTSSAPATGGSGTLTYTWQFSTTSSVAGSGSWTDIPASNSATWDYGTLTQTTYFVRKAVDAVCGTVYSNVLTVTVRPLLTGGTIASSQTICYNSDVSAFTSSAPATGGSGTITYTWQYSTTSSTAGSGSWTDIPASNSATWDYGTLTQTTYFVRKAVDAVCGTVYSNVLTITVYPQLTAGTIAASQTICFNNDVAAFTSTAAASGGSGAITYTWQYSTTTSVPGSGSWTDIPASNSATWDYGTLTQTTYFVRKAVDAVCGTVYSNVLTITVNPQFTAGTIASDQTICYNNDVAAFTSSAPAAGGSGTHTYTWQYSTTSSTAGSGSWTYIPASNSATWDYGTLTQTTYFVRKAVDAVCGTVYSNVLTVTVRPLLTGGSIAADQTICYGNDVSPFTSPAPASGGSGAITYTWQYSTTTSTPGSGSWSDIPASNSVAWDYGTLTQTTWFVRKAVDASCGTVYSNVVKVTVRPQMVGGTIASDLTICFNDDVAPFTSVLAASGGSGVITYTWQYSTTSQIAGSGSWTDIPGSDSPVLDYGTLTETTYFVRRAVDAVCGTVYSNVLTVTVNPLFTGGTVGSDQAICSGEDIAAFTSASPASGGSGSVTYTWQYSESSSTPGSGSWTDIPSSNSAIIDYGVVVNTTYFTRKAVDASCGTTYSNVITVTADPAPSADAGPDDVVCYNTSAYQISLASVNGTSSFIWSTPDGSGTFDMVNITDPVYTVGNADLHIGKGGDIHFVLTADGEGACSGISVTDTMTLTIAPELIASVGAPSPFLIGTNTQVEVKVKIENRYILNDLGFYLVSPDDSIVILKISDSPLSYCNWNDLVDVTFRNIPPPADTISSCFPATDLIGEYRATGDWSKLVGQDPANGVWKIVIQDYADFPVSLTEGVMTDASISFTDLNHEGNLQTLYYDMKGSTIEINNAENAGIPAETFYNVSLGLRTGCYNSCDATAIVTPVGGVAPYQIQWSDGFGTNDTVNLCAGTFYVVITDALGCSDTATVIVESPDPIIIEDVQHTQTIICAGDESGVIRTKASGGTGLLTYKLMPGDISSEVPDSGVFTGLASGTYQIVVTDASGCTRDTTITIDQLPALQVDIDITNITGSGTGSILLTASGGTAPYQYSIDNGNTLEDTGLFEDLPAGTYDIYVIDDNGCIFTETVDILVLQLDVDVNSSGISCYGLTDGSFFLRVTNGTAPFTLTGDFLADPVESTDGIFAFSGQPAGSYILSISDTEGRVFNSTIVLESPEEITSTAVITDATCSANTFDGAIDITAAGGTGTLLFSWSSGQSTADITAVEAGSYSVIITDDNDCEATFEYDVSSVNVATAYAGEDDAICPGTVYQLFGSDGDSVRWSPAAFTDDPEIPDPHILINESTEFILTVYDNQCFDVDTVVIDVYDVPEMDIYDPSGAVEIDTALFLLEGESFEIEATEGFQSYLWVPSDGLSSTTERTVMLTPAANAYYSVTGTTTEGCTGSDTIHVAIAAKLEILSGFTPNGDEFNPTWEIRHAVEYGDKIRVQVFNRWGEKVFESKGYGGDNEWDGTRNGKPLPIGAYYYIIELGDGKSGTYTGTVTIIR